MSVRFLLVQLCTALFAAVSASADQSVLSASLDAALRDAPGKVAACAVALPSGEQLYNRNANELVHAASIQKLVTTAAVFDRFGPEAHLATEIYVDGETGQKVRRLYLRGLGDPSLTTETLWLLARALRSHGVRDAGELVIDDTLYEGMDSRHGQRAYEGRAAALAFNFNAISVTACPGPSGKAAIVSTEPFEGGLLTVGSIPTVAHGSSGIEVNERSDAGIIKYAVSGHMAAGDKCVNVYRSIEDPAELAGRYFKQILSYLGIRVGLMRKGATPSSAVLLEHFASKPLHEIVWGMNHWSTNVVADQLMMTLADPAAKFVDQRPVGEHLRRTDALAQLNSFARSLNPGFAPVLVDGSGLSRENKAPAALFCRLLASEYGKINSNVEFENSLAVSGRSGTLRERDFELPRGTVRGKTGSLDGVSSLAGYLVTRRGNKYAFAVIQNSALQKAEAVIFEDRFVRALYNDADR